MKTIFVSPEFPLNRRMRKAVRRGKLQVVRDREGGERLSSGDHSPPIRTAEERTEDKVSRLLSQVKELAGEYYRLTGKPLGITAEMGEYEAARILRLTLAKARQPGYDATDKDGRRYQIKARCLPGEEIRNAGRIGQIRNRDGWDALLLVLLNERFDVFGIWEVDQEEVLHALDSPGSISRNQRRALSVNEVMKIGTKIWPQKG